MLQKEYDWTKEETENYPSEVQIVPDFMAISPMSLHG